MTSPPTTLGDDELVRTLSADGSVAVRAVVGSALVGEAIRRHELAPTAANALGRGLMGGVLIAAGSDEDEVVQLQFKGDGPLGSMIVIANPRGQVRGTVARAATELPLRDDGHADVPGAIGKGILVVVRSHPRRREPYTGITPLENGEVATDLARYLTDSEQTPSAVGLGVALAPDGHVAAAGGFFVQALPDADDEVLAIVERNVRSIWSPAEMIRSGARGEDMLDILLQGVGLRAIERREPRYHCPCGRDRVARTVVLLGRAELEEIVRTDGELEIRCEFCGTRYALGSDEISALIPDA